MRPILERGQANANLENRDWTEPSLWPDWTLSPLKAKYAVIAEIVANLLENAFKYAQKDAEIGLTIMSKGLCIIDNGKKITKNGYFTSTSTKKFAVIKITTPTINVLVAPAPTKARTISKVDIGAAKIS